MFCYENEEEQIEDIENRTCYSWQFSKKDIRRKPLYKYAKHSSIKDLDLFVENVDRSNW